MRTAKPIERLGTGQSGVRLYWLILLAVFLWAGCVEEKGTMSVQPNGAGRIDLEVRFGPQLTGSIRDEVARGGELLRVSRSRLGGNWKGIAFWTDENVEVEDQRVFYKGSAWFRDLNALDFSGTPCKWTRREEDSGFDLEFSFDPLPARQEGQSRAAQAEQLREILEGFAVELTIRLPGAVREVEGNGGFRDREAIYRLSAADLFEGARLEEEERARRFHRFRVKVDPPLPEAEKEEAAFEEEWRAKEAVGVRHASIVQPCPALGLLPRPPPLESPLTRSAWVVETALRIKEET